MSWLVRLYRNDGTDSTIARYGDEEHAQRVADKLNTDLQTDEYRVEEYDPAKAAQFFKDCDGVLKRMRKG